jgi:integrase
VETVIDDPYGAEVRRAFLFACNTGLRISDLETLTWGKIETNPMQIIKSQEKPKKTGYIPLNEEPRSKLLGIKDFTLKSLSIRGNISPRTPSYRSKLRGIKPNASQ